MAGDGDRDAARRSRGDPRKAQWCLRSGASSTNHASTNAIAMTVAAARYDVQRTGERMQVRVAHGIRQLVHGSRAERGRQRRAGRQRSHHPRLQPVREQRAERRDTERAADRAEQRCTRRRDAHVPEFDRVLHGERQHGHHHAEADPEQRHVRVHRVQRRIERQRRQQRHRDAAGQRAGIGNIRYEPSREISRPLTIDVTSIPPIIGSSCIGLRRRRPSRPAGRAE